MEEERWEDHQPPISLFSFYFIMQLLLLTLLPAVVSSLTDFTTCDADPSLACFDDTDCTAPAQCSTVDAIPPTAPAAGAMGCCVGGVTTTTSTTTVASVTTTTAVTCVDKLNPLTGVSDCPARASLCSNSVYLEVMRDQCPRTCNFCSSSTSTNSTSTTSCVDLVNPNTRVSDCPQMRAYCTNPVYQALMRVQCPATCGFCTSG